MLGLCCRVPASSGCGGWGVRRPLTAAASLPRGPGSRARGLHCCARAQWPCGMWNLSGPGIESLSPALAGESLTTGPPGKSHSFVLIVHIHQGLILGSQFCSAGLCICFSASAVTWCFRVYGMVWRVSLLFHSAGELNLFLLSSVSGHVCCLCFLVIKTCAALNMDVQASVSTPELCSLGHVVALFHF